VITAMVQCLGK